MHWRRLGIALMMLACVATTQTLDAHGKKSAKKLEEPPACPASFDDSLETNGVAPKAGPGTGIAPPKLVHRVEAEMTDEVRLGYGEATIKQKDFNSMIRLIVDKEGLPQEICVASPAGYGLDAQAAFAVRQYRFEPATKDSQPVKVRLAVEVSFHFV